MQTYKSNGVTCHVQSRLVGSLERIVATISHSTDLDKRLSQRPELGGTAVLSLACQVVLGGSREVLLGGGGEVLCGCSWEVILLDLDLWRSGTSTVLVDSLLGLCGCLLCVALDSLDSVPGMLVSKFLDLLSLLVGNAVALLNLGIDGLLVLNVDEGTEEGEGSGDQGQAPERNELDEEVGDQGCEESLKNATVSQCRRGG